MYSIRDFSTNRVIDYAANTDAAMRVAKKHPPAKIYNPDGNWIGTSSGYFQTGQLITQKAELQ